MENKIEKEIVADSGNSEKRDSIVEKGADEQGTVLSKSQLKKLKKKEKWEEVKVHKRKAVKERQKARKKECRERGEELGPSRKQLSKNRMENSSCKIKVAVDCDFDDYMAEKDIKMLVKQIQFSYSANRRAVSPMQFYCCGVGNKTKERLESLADYKGWDIYFHSESFDSMFDKSSITYLSSESPNVLQDLEEDKVYIIGGLVDHNHHKGLCHKLAEEKGLSHAQLPISEYIDMKTRKVLTINHVFEILLRFTESKDWQKAFYSVLPPRKGAKLKKIDGADTSDSVIKEGEKDTESFENKVETSKSTCDDKVGGSEVDKGLQCDVPGDVDASADLCRKTSTDIGEGDGSDIADKINGNLHRDLHDQIDLKTGNTESDTNASIENLDSKEER